MTMKTFHTLISLSIVLVCLGSTVGCKPKGLDVQPIEGVVTLDGEPFADVTISLFPMEATGHMGFANTDNEGRYRISSLGGVSQGGTTMGTYQVSFNKLVPDGRVPTAAEMDAPDFNPRHFSGLDRTKDLVPKKYQLPSTSGFEITVQKGKNEYNFDLLSK